jgi:ribosomal-protein-alanine N-acetyltransferase
MSQNLELRLARLTDAKQIGLMSRDLIEVGLCWSWTPARIAKQIRSPDTTVLTACLKGHVVGFAVMQFFVEGAYLNLLAVAPAYQRLGIGWRLIEWLEESARVAGTFIVYLEVRASNQGARAFYRKLGYREIIYVPRYYGGHEPAVRMAHDLYSGYYQDLCNFAG